MNKTGRLKTDVMAGYAKGPAIKPLNRGPAPFDVSVDAANSASKQRGAGNAAAAVPSERRVLHLAAERDLRALVQAGQRRRRALQAASDEERTPLLEQARETGRMAKLQVTAYAERGPRLLASYPFATAKLLNLYRTEGLTIEQAEQRLRRVCLEVPDYEGRIARAHQAAPEIQAPKKAFRAGWGRPLIGLLILAAGIAAAYALIRLPAGSL